MRKVILAIALTLVGVGCGAADGAPGEPSTTDREVVSPEAVIRRCLPSLCGEAGGVCQGDVCEPGCENSPLNCTAVNVVPEGFALTAAGALYISCEGIGNGTYTVQLTSAPATPGGIGVLSGPPDGPWTPWTDGPTAADGNFVFNGTPIAFGAPGPYEALDEDNMWFPGCSRDPGGPACTIVATYVNVCAVPGVAPLTEQSGVCGSGGESLNPTCVEVPVTASYAAP